MLVAILYYVLTAFSSIKKKVYKEKLHISNMALEKS